jgi:gluconate 2-dehydrogenase gamma chain
MATILGVVDARARSISGGLPWQPGAADPPAPVRPGPWQFFTHDEVVAIEAIVDRLIPQDELGPGGKAAGCAVYIDRMLAGPFGDSRRLYMRPPFLKALPQQGPQSSLVPRSRYRSGLAALDTYCRTNFRQKSFADLTTEQQDTILRGLEEKTIALPNLDGEEFFGEILQHTLEGFFGDPIYGGNREMVSWKLIGFPGARYDYRDFVKRHNERYPLPPVSILGRAEWSAQR